MMTTTMARRFESQGMVTSDRSRLSERLLLIGGFILVAIFAFFPIYWMLITSVTPVDQVFNFPPRLVPSTITLEFYGDFFNNPALLRYLFNSVVVAGTTAITSVAISVYAGYSFSKFRYTGRKALMFLILSAQMFPQTLLLITLYLMFARLGLLNSYWALILSFTSFTLPLCVWMLKGYFDTLPDELIEAAKVDGASQFTIIHRILLPIARPALISTFLFAFIRGWNDFIYALTLGGSEYMTLPPGLVLSGTCAAITAARAGLTVTLVHDRPVLGGNGSSEVRLWMLGATAHMGNNNRWAREGGVVGEILIENLYRNPDGNPLIVDTILLEKVITEPNIRLLLNTAAWEITKSDADTIESVRAFCSQNSTLYDVRAPLFMDASGDGVIGFLSGAAFRMGAETSDEFGEALAPSAEYGELLGHSIYFYTKDIGKPVKFIPPSFALEDITQIPRFRSFNSKEQGCRLWWIEYGGRLDTVHDTETIKWELWKVVYGVWNHIKNSGIFPDAETLTLEWVGHIPGKRESRRFEGDYMLRQQDLIAQHRHPDAVAYGGWALDLHPADGIYSEKPGCNQWHARGVYQIPYRTLYSRNITNLFIIGRIMSASHVAFSSSRVMLTGAHAAQAAAMAAVLCHKNGVLPAQIAQTPYIETLQRELLRRGQYIPHVPLSDPDDLMNTAQLSTSSALALVSLPDDGQTVPLRYSWAQMLPIPAGAPVPAITFTVDVAQPTTLRFELRTSDAPANHTPDVLLASDEIDLPMGVNQHVTFSPAVRVDQARYIFACLMKNPAISVHTSEKRVTGILSVANAQNPAVSNFGVQQPREDIGIETFEFWVPMRRPHGRNLAFTLSAPLSVFDVENVRNGWGRPTFAPNAWVAALDDAAPCLQAQWAQPQTIAKITLSFDSDFDHPMETVLMGHPESRILFCVNAFRIRAGETLVAQVDDNHLGEVTLTLAEPLVTNQLQIEILTMQGDVPASVFAMRCYAPQA